MITAKKRIMGFALAVLMLSSLIPGQLLLTTAQSVGEVIAALVQNITNKPSVQNAAFQTEATYTVVRRPVPVIECDATEVVRVAGARYAYTRGSTIVKATPSGVPELNSGYIYTDAVGGNWGYDGELPEAPFLDVRLFMRDQDIIKDSTGAIISPVIDSFTVTVGNNSTTTQNVTLSANNAASGLGAAQEKRFTLSGTAKEGTNIEYKIVVRYKWLNEYAHIWVTDNYETTAYSRVESISFPAGGWHWVAQEWTDKNRCDISFEFRVLGRNTVATQMTPKNDSSGWVEGHGFIDVSVADRYNFKYNEPVAYKTDRARF
ncbi:MAG: hypothetical protein LBB67_02700, partial [Oscillospiraceae bacterium]|nr:hypothetical protein [Oscillospiraceae bacterium]